MPDGLTGVILMSFGTAERLEDMPAYLERIRGGSPAPESLVQEFQRRYRIVGGSPLTRITHEQAAALEVTLNARSRGPFKVVVGMRHAAPFIAEAFKELAAAGARRVVAFILAPQHTPIIMAGYYKAIEDSRPLLPPGTPVLVPGVWHLRPAFIAALASRLREVLDTVPKDDRATVPVLFSAHSVPRVIVDKEPEYIDMLKATSKAVAEKAGLPAGQWRFAYQSAGHTAQEWLRPDIKEIFPELAAAGHRRVIIAPVQFLSDHMEVLYDIDVAAREQAEEAGITMLRTPMLNTLPAFIEAMADVVLDVL